MHTHSCIHALSQYVHPDTVSLTWLIDFIQLKWISCPDENNEFDLVFFCLFVFLAEMNCSD